MKICGITDRISIRFKEAYEKLRKYKFGVELGSTHLFKYDPDIYKDILVIHLLDDIDLAYPDNHKRRMYVRLIKDYLEFAFGGERKEDKKEKKKFVVHFGWDVGRFVEDGGKYKDNYNVEIYEESLLNILESINKSNYNTEILLENSIIDPDIFTEFIKHFKEKHKEYKDTIWICFDAGHANVFSYYVGTTNMYEYVDKLKDYIKHVHLTENNGKRDEHKPIIGKFGDDFYKFLLSNIDTETITIEANYIKNLKKSRRYIRNILKKLKKETK